MAYLWTLKLWSLSRLKLAQIKHFLTTFNVWIAQLGSYTWSEEVTTRKTKKVCTNLSRSCQIIITKLSKRTRWSTHATGIQRLGSERSSSSSLDRERRRTSRRWSARCTTANLKFGSSCPTLTSVATTTVRAHSTTNPCTCSAGLQTILENTLTISRDTIIPIGTSGTWLNCPLDSSQKDKDAELSKETTRTLSFSVAFLASSEMTPTSSIPRQIRSRVPLTRLMRHSYSKCRRYTILEQILCIPWISRTNLSTNSTTVDSGKLIAASMLAEHLLTPTYINSFFEQCPLLLYNIRF